MVAKSKVKRAVKAKSTRASSKLKQDPDLKKEVNDPPPPPPPPPNDEAINQMRDAVQGAADSAQRQAESIAGLIAALEKQINDNRLMTAGEPAPVRLKVHRDKNKLIEYIDVIPVEVVKH